MQPECVCDANPFQPLQCDFKELLETHLFSDFTLILANPPAGKEQKIAIHRFLLDSCSSFFRNFFEKCPDETELHVCFPDWAVPAVFIIIDSIYSSGVLNFNNENISSIYAVADMWGMEAIRNRAAIFLQYSVSPRSSLLILSRIADALVANPPALNHLVDLVVSNFYEFDPEPFMALKFPLFDQIMQRIYAMRPEDEKADKLCTIIEKYITINVQKIGSTEFEQLVRRFTMRSNHSGILSIYKTALQFHWSIDQCENKIIHAWRHFDPEVLSKFPVDHLSSMLHENYLNVESDDCLFDFVLLVHQHQPSADITSLWKALRYSSMTPEYQEKFRNCELIPEEIKQERMASVSIGRRLPRTEIRCLILGAADDASLEDVKHQLVVSCFTEQNIIALRGDRPIDVDFAQFHLIFVFGFYRFYQPAELSQRLFEYNKAGGGLIIAFGAMRPDKFGLGEPLLSLLPIDSSGVSTSPKEADDLEIGCRHMRMICKAKEGSIIENYWNDGIPFVVVQKGTETSGGIVVINGTPVSNAIIPGQWNRDDKSIIRYFTNAAVTVANYV